jgi:hypothetical protein
MSNVDAEDLIARLSGGLAPVDRPPFARPPRMPWRPRRNARGKGRPIASLRDCGASTFIRRRIRASQAGTRNASGRRPSSSRKASTGPATASVIFASLGERRGVLGRNAPASAP